MHGLRLIAGAAVFAVSAVAVAAATNDAESHFRAIARSDVDGIMSANAEGARFEWVGGPLDGSNIGAHQIRQVWLKFANANAPLAASVAKIEQSDNPAGSTVTDDVEFKGQNTIKVRYVLAYRSGKIVSEVWQIDPKLRLAGY